MNRITAHQILTIYNRITGHSYTVKSTAVRFDVLDGIVTSTWKKIDNNAFYEHRSIKSKAAVQCLAIVRKAPFPDRNTQVAILATLTLLDLNNICIDPLHACVQELYELLQKDTTTEDDVRDWISSYDSSSVS